MPTLKTSLALVSGSGWCATVDDVGQRRTRPMVCDHKEQQLLSVTVQATQKETLRV